MGENFKSFEEDFESFGEQENLVDRLRDLTKCFDADLDVFKELIQNSDDARATEVKICLDLRSNNNYKEDLLSSEIAEVQGEAFWFYNNARLSDEDFENIVKFGVGNKTEKVGVIGNLFYAAYMV